MDRGYIRVYRKIEDSPIFSDDHLLKLFVWILLRVTHKPITLTVPTGRGKSVVKLEPGQALIGRKAIARKLHWPESSARNRLARLAQILDGDMDIQADTHYSIVTIRNYEIYQGRTVDDRTGKRTSKRTGKGQAKDTNKHYKHLDTTGANGVGPIRDLYVSLFEEKLGKQPIINFSKDGALLKSILRVHGEDGTRDLLRRFFSSSDPFIAKAGYTIGVLHSQVNKLVGESARESESPEYEGTGNRRLESLVPSSGQP